MIIVRLEGGLGNIMFQYSLGRHLAYKNKVELRFDIESFKTNPLGDYSFSLEMFNIDIRNRLATPDDIKKFKKYQRKAGKIWFLYNRLMVDTSKYVQRRNYHFAKDILNLKGDLYLHGWWQNEKYFIDIRNILLNDFTLRNPIEENNKKLAREISDTNAVGIHIRRQDYVNNPKTKSHHGSLTKKYYDEALIKISSKIQNITLFIFSDDIDWVKKNMVFPFKTVYVEGNIETPHEDMHLMSLCKHHIVANSSFSWWGAWLSANVNKIVVAPKKWTNNPKDTNEQVPSSWIKI